MTAPLPSRDAIEAAAKILREGRLPPRHKVARILDALDAMALAMTLSGSEPAQKPSQFHRQEA